MMLDNVTGRCSGCEWTFGFSTQAPTGTGTAVLNAGGTAITVASGGASFTNGMLLLCDTAQNAEVLTINGVSTATNIPIAAAVRGHSFSVTFGQLLISSTYSGTGQEQVPAVSPYLAGGRDERCPGADDRAGRAVNAGPEPGAAARPAWRSVLD
jgi:hypothetical protein